MFTLASEFISGESYTGYANTLADATKELLDSNIKLNTTIYNPQASGAKIQHYSVTVEGVFCAGTKDLMKHYLEIF